MLACLKSDVQVIARTLMDFTFIAATGPWSWYSWLPVGSLEVVSLALPPKEPRSPFSAVIQPPSVILTSHGVLTGGVQILVASPNGSPGPWVLLVFVSA